ncbi:hypothetical protein HHI36_019811 [Cryptolaemus montrouzieri]|uniref:DNA primase large subunit C-terminal domain-containing protein n=1 Tax=Cryptolaemus montrouzieri TaxID=559131 RepID=A0ABD2N929_9CUCU
MSFYLKPPKGQINLHDLRECIKQRIQCFHKIENGLDIRDIDKFEYLVEDSILDRTGHFVFRLGVLAGVLPKKTFLDNELKLFFKRMEFYDKDDTQHFLKNMIRQLRDCIHSNITKQLSDFYWTLYNVISKMLQKGYLSHVFTWHSKDDDTVEPCTNKLCILVPFWYCHKLISTRKVDLRNGNALFECHQWKDVLPSLYLSYLNIVLNEMKYSRSVASTMVDHRISGCLKILSEQYPKVDDFRQGTVRLKDVEEESVYFPLCMKNLYDTLRKKHRLAHNDRFDLSLFLKGMGLSLNDSIKFWQGEYSKQHSSCSKCSHSWQNNEKKYIYGIRHMYGLEGSRRNYSVKSCAVLQGAGIGINCEGGCPFTHYDDDFLRSALKKNLPGFEDDIEVIIYERKENASFSCKLYRECTSRRLKQNSLEDEAFSNPLQYYNQLKNT